MDRDHARGFVRQVLEKEENFLAELKEFQEQIESAENWDSISRDFAPNVKTFYNAQLEQWNRFYLGLDSANMRYGFTVMHMAQKKEKAGAEATIPHSVFGELKQKIKVGQTNTKLSATGGRAARDIIEKKLGQGEQTEFETRGKGGKLGGGLDAIYDEDDVNPADHMAVPSKPPLTSAPPEKQKAAPPPPPTKKEPKTMSAAQAKFAAAKEEAEKSKDPALGDILQRRKGLYGSGKY